MVSFIGYLWQNPVQLFALVASVTTAVSAIWLGYVKNESDRQKYVEQDQKTQRLIETQAKVIEEQRSLVTGGNAYVYLEPSNVMPEEKILLLYKHVGGYPIYDASMTIESWDAVRNGNGFSFVNHKQEERQLSTVTPNQNFHYEREVNLVGSLGKRYFVAIRSRNGIMEEDIYYLRFGKTMARAYKIVFLEANYGNQPLALPISKIRRIKKHFDSAFDPSAITDHRNGDTGWDANYDLAD